MRSSPWRSRPELVELGLPFLSPDGQWVGFANTSFEIRKVAITGGAAHDDRQGRRDSAGCDVGGRRHDRLRDQPYRHGVAASLGQRWRARYVDAADRERGEADHFWPELLPGGHAVLFTITSRTGEVDAAQVAVRDLSTGTQKILVRGGSDAHYVHSGHLVYIAAGVLRAIPFDVDRLETRGRRSRCCRWSRRWVSGGGAIGGISRSPLTGRSCSGRAGRGYDERTHAGVGRPNGQGRGHRCAAARLPPASSLARRKARRRLEQRSDERYLDRGPGTKDRSRR